MEPEPDPSLFNKLPQDTVSGSENIDSEDVNQSQDDAENIEGSSDEDQCGKHVSSKRRKKYKTTHKNADCALKVSKKRHIRQIYQQTAPDWNKDEYQLCTHSEIMKDLESFRIETEVSQQQNTETLLEEDNNSDDDDGQVDETAETAPNKTLDIDTLGARKGACSKLKRPKVQYVLQEEQVLEQPVYKQRSELSHSDFQAVLRSTLNELDSFNLEVLRPKLLAEQRRVKINLD